MPLIYFSSLSCFGVQGLCESDGLQHACASRLLNPKTHRFKEVVLNYFYAKLHIVMLLYHIERWKINGQSSHSPACCQKVGYNNDLNFDMACFQRRASILFYSILFFLGGFNLGNLGAYVPAASWHVVPQCIQLQVLHAKSLPTLISQVPTGSEWDPNRFKWPISIHFRLKISLTVKLLPISPSFRCCSRDSYA